MKRRGTTRPLASSTFTPPLSLSFGASTLPSNGNAPNDRDEGEVKVDNAGRRPFALIPAGVTHVYTVVLSSSFKNAGAKILVFHVVICFITNVYSQIVKKSQWRHLSQFFEFVSFLSALLKIKQYSHG